MPSHPHDSRLAPASTPRPRRVGLSIWKEARIREILRTTTTPSEPWVDAQIKSALNITPALSELNFRIDACQFDTGVVDLHLPFDAFLPIVDIGRPSGGFLLQHLDVAEAAAKALTRQ
jgi:hypothetical protein